MRTHLLILSGCLALATTRVAAQSSPSSAQKSDSFVVVVNSANPIKEISHADLMQIFLKRVSKWSNGAHVAPVDLGRRSPVRAVFTKDVHNRSVASIGTYWQQQIFSGRDTPPPEKSSDADVVTFVRETPGGIGYVDPDTPLGKGVKVVPIHDS